MNLRILIAEDKQDEFETSKKVCKRLAKNMGFIILEDNIDHAKTISDTISLLKQSPFNYDIVILDIGFGETDINVDEISNYLQNDTLIESKVIIHSGNPDFKTNSEKILSAICNGAKTIAIKGETGILSFETQFIRVLRDIKLEAVWANIGRFTPQWKRNIFRDEELWRNLETGIRSPKAIFLADISYSTQFVIAQRNFSINDQYILELFKSFAHKSTEILEKSEYQGIIERYSGDEILAYFNQVDSENLVQACLNAIEAAFEILECFNQLYIDLKSKYGYKKIMINQTEINPGLRILIGCGEVMWVLQGSSARKQLSIMTEQVAKCYRSFTHTDSDNNRTLIPDQVFITQDVYYLVKDSDIVINHIPTKLNLRDFGNQNIYEVNREII